MAKSNIRSLIELQKSGSTARVLNLLSVWKRHASNSEIEKAPFFQNRHLNRSIVIKHRLRASELELFEESRLKATKFVFPIDPNDLKLGGRSLLIGQKNWNTLLEDFLGKAPDPLDLALIELLDNMHTLDPFLLREELRRHGYNPSNLYLELSEADLKKIYAFALGQIEPLVRMSLNGSGGLASHVSRFVGKILNYQLDHDFDPLRQVMRMSEGEFSEGIFCWKGFLYYKWLYDQTASALQDVKREIATVQPRTPVSHELRKTLARRQFQFGRRLDQLMGAVQHTLGRYDEAYLELTTRENPLAFRNFLLAAPNMFVEIGERLGGIQHVTSFWRYRFPSKKPSTVPAEDLMELFDEFNSHLHWEEGYAEKLRA